MEHEILNEMDETKKRFDKDLEAMEHQERQHEVDLNEYTELLSFCRSGNTDRQDNREEQKKEEEEEARGERNKRLYYHPRKREKKERTEGG